MKSEEFCDALNYLDDELIEETDSLRQGRPLARPGRRVIRWLVPAACLTLVIGLGLEVLPEKTAMDSNGLFFENAAEMAPENPALVQDSMESGKSTYSENAAWQTVSAEGITVSIPADWTWRQESGEDSFHLFLCPAEVSGELVISRDPAFGVCGTGLKEEEILIGGRKAIAGYYDGGTNWSFIVIPVDDQKYVIRKDGAEAWWNASRETVDRILATLRID